MSAANLLIWWQGALVWTALLIVAVLVLRRPVARVFGANAAYWLWALPLARLLTPALTGAPDAAPTPALLLAEPLHINVASLTVAPPPPPTLAETIAAALPGVETFALIWAVGAVLLLGAGLYADRRYRREIMAGATALEPIGGIRLVMSDAAEGPVAFGLFRRTIAVPRDFFLRYDAAERALALDHELAHHRGFDLWANFAALVLLSVQWFNPFAWTAWRAFRFDQEAACDARVLARAGAPAARTYAHAVAKTAVGRNFALAAPMAVNQDVKERIRMMIDNPETPRRKLAGSLLLGGALAASLALTATVLPAAAYVADDEPAADAADAAPKEVKREHHVIMINADDAASAAHADGAEHRMHRIVISKDGDAGPGDKVMVFSSEDGEVDIDGGPEGEKRVMRFKMPMMGLSTEDIEKTLVEQGIDAAKAKDIAAKLEAQRAEKMKVAFAPMADMKGAHAMHFMSKDGAAVAIAKCKDGKPGNVLVDRSASADGQTAKVRMVRCADGPVDVGMQIDALKKARERLAADLGKEGGMSKEIRASVLADIDKSIAELEAKK